MKLSDIIFDYGPQSKDALDKPFRVLGDPHVRIIDRRLSHTNSCEEDGGAEEETTYYYYVLVFGFDAFGELGSAEWHPEGCVWQDIEDFYVPRLCDNA